MPLTCQEYVNLGILVPSQLRHGVTFGGHVNVSGVLEKAIRGLRLGKN